MMWNNEIIFAAVLQDLSQGKRVKLAGTGTSMEPTIHADTDKLVLAAPDALQLGQICLYRRPGGGYAIHRIQSITKNRVVLLGDNQLKTETVAPEQVLAQVVAIERDGSTIDTTVADFLRKGYRANQRRLRQFRRRALSYQLINFPRRLLKKFIKK